MLSLSLSFLKAPNKVTASYIAATSGGNKKSEKFILVLKKTCLSFQIGTLLLLLLYSFKCLLVTLVTGHPQSGVKLN